MRITRDKKIGRKDLFVGILFVSAVFVLGMKLLNPTPVQIIVGENEAVVAQIPGFFTYSDVVIILASSLVLGFSGAYFMLSVERKVGEQVLERRKKEWEQIAGMLRDDEQWIYQTIVESGGVISQSELVEKTGMSKAGVSRALDLLESKGLVERRRRGMGNIVLLK